MLESWNLLDRAQSVTTDNASDMVRGVELLRKRLFAQIMTSVDYADPEQFYIRCISHVINLPVIVSMDTMGFEIDKIRKITAFVKVSVKRRDVYSNVGMKNILKNVFLDRTAEPAGPPRL